MRLRATVAATATLAASLASAQPPQAAPAAPDVSSALGLAKGRIVVLNFWASWCAPCVREMPLLARLSREYGPKGVDVIAPSIDDAEERDAARAFVRRHALPFTIVYGATTADMIERRLGNSVPATVILDRSGEPRFRLVGEMKEKDLRARLDVLLEGGDSATALPEVVVPDGMTVEHFVKDHESGEAEEEHAHEEEGGSATPG